MGYRNSLVQMTTALSQWRISSSAHRTGKCRTNAAGAWDYLLAVSSVGQWAESGSQWAESLGGSQAVEMGGMRVEKKVVSLVCL